MRPMTRRWYAFCSAGVAPCGRMAASLNSRKSSIMSVGQAHELEEDPRRQRHAERLVELDLGLIDEPVDQLVGDVGDMRLEVRDDPRREQRIEQLAVLRVLGAVDLQRDERSLVPEDALVVGPGGHAQLLTTSRRFVVARRSAIFVTTTTPSSRNGPDCCISRKTAPGSSTANASKSNGSDPAGVAALGGLVRVLLPASYRSSPAPRREATTLGLSPALRRVPLPGFLARFGAVDAPAALALCSAACLSNICCAAATRFSTSSP